MSEPLEVALVKALLAQLNVPTLGYPVAHPFVTFVPPSPPAPYIDARPYMRATPDHPFLGFTASTLKRGVFQVDAVVPDGSGEAPGLRIAALIAARFPIGTTLSAGGRKLQLNFEPTIAAPVKDAPWIRFPVSIPVLLIH